VLASLLLLACLSPTELSVVGGDSAATGTPDTAPPVTDTEPGETDSDSGGTTDGETTEPTDDGPQDADGDGHASDVDCNDDDPDIHPLAYDDCDGIDDDCNDLIDDATDCPCPINHFGANAYLFCESRATWQDASAACGDSGYALVTVDSADENAWLHETAAILSSREWWSGFNDRDDEGTFSWVSGAPVSYTNWASGEPNDYGRGEDCAPLLSADNERWNDVSCEEDLRYICEAG